MSKPQRISYVIMAVLLFLIAWLHLGTLTLTTLFGYFALRLFTFRGRKWLAALIYLVTVCAIGTGLFFFSRAAYVALPDIADKTIPAVVNFAEKQGIELPFTDYASLKVEALQHVRESFANIGRYAGMASFVLVQLIIGLVVALSLFLDARWGTETDAPATRNSLYASLVAELSLRARTFFASFSMVIGAQISISLINTLLTSIFLAWNHFPYAAVIIGLTF